MRVSSLKLSVARSNAGLSQPELADGLTRRLNRKRPVHFTTISRWEKGPGPTSIDVAVAIAAECGIGDFRELLEEDDEEADSVTFMVPLTLDGDLLRRLGDVVAAARAGGMQA